MMKDRHRAQVTGPSLTPIQIVIETLRESITFPRSYLREDAVLIR